MEDYLEIDLIPTGIKNQMRMIKRVSICAEMGAVAVLIVMGVVGLFHDLVTFIIFALVLLSITTPLLVPGFMFDKVSQSTVRFTERKISVFDRRGNCWKSIAYDAITDIRIEEISGFFYGQNQDLFRNKYVCLFLNGSTQIPNVSFAELFAEKDFMFFAYNTKAIFWLNQKQLI